MQQWIGLVARLIVGGVWLVAGALKLPDPDSSVIAVRAYEVLPETLVVPVGQVLPAVEIVVGLCLVLGALTRPAALLSTVLFAAFVLGIASVWARGIEIDCGCFGGGGADDGATSGYPWEIARDLGLMLLSAWLVLRPGTRWSVDALLRPGADRDDTTDDESEPAPTSSGK